jgi:hypothetical protein
MPQVLLNMLALPISVNGVHGRPRAHQLLEAGNEVCSAVHVVVETSLPAAAAGAKW